MNKFYLLAALCLLFGSQVAAGIIYVSPTGNGNGASWQEAANFKQALASALADDEIWLTSGTYLPGNDRQATFLIPSGVKVFGSFIGTETARHQRNFQAAGETILSGNIGTSSQEDNVFTVVTFRNAAPATLLADLTIAHGYAMAMEYTDGVATCGAAIYNDGRGGISSPTLRNLRILNNRSRNGAGIYNDGRQRGQASPIIIGCTFQGNKADFKGGALYNNGTRGQSSPRVQKCNFVNNTANNGGAIINFGKAGTSSPLIAECTFTRNTAITAGCAIFNVIQENGQADPILQDVRFQDNSCKLGGDVSSNVNNAPVAQQNDNSNGFRERTVAANNK